VASVGRRGEMRWGYNLLNEDTVLLLLFSLGLSLVQIFCPSQICATPIPRSPSSLPLLLPILSLFDRVVLVVVYYLSSLSFMWYTSSSTYDSILNVQGVFKFVEVVSFRMCRVHRRVVFSHPYLFVTNAASSTIDARIS